jgi:hypothetical protein
MRARSAQTLLRAGFAATLGFVAFVVAPPITDAAMQQAGGPKTTAAYEKRGGPYQATQARAKAAGVLAGRREAEQVGAASQEAGPADAQVSFGGFQAPDYKKGQEYTESGQVLGVAETPGGPIVLVLKGVDGKKAHVLGFVQPAGQTFQSGQWVSFTGRFVGQKEIGKEKVTAYAFDGVTVQAAPGQGAPGQTAPGQTATGQPGQGQQPVAPPEKPKFEDLYGGWRFVGTATGEGRDTAVFVQEDKVRFAGEGESFDDGLKVHEVGDGWAEVRFGKSPSSVLTPW